MPEQTHNCVPDVDCITPVIWLTGVVSAALEFPMLRLRVAFLSAVYPPAH